MRSSALPALECLEARTLLSDGPDLALSFGPPMPNYSAYVPGDTITLPLTIRNLGTLPAVGTSVAPITIDIRGSANSTYEPFDYLLTRITLPSTLGAGASVTRKLTLKLPSSIVPGSYYVVAGVDTTSVVAETTETNNTAATAAPFNVVWQAGAVGGRPGSVPLTFADADGTSVTLKVKGPGTATLTSSGGAFDIALSGTTNASSLTFTTARPVAAGDNGRFALRNLTIGNPLDTGDRTSIGSIKGATTDSSGDVTVTGSASAITLGNTSGQHRVSIGAPLVAPRVAPAVTLTFASVTDLSIQSAVGIKSLQVTEWHDTNGTADLIAAPSIGRLTAKGNKTLGRIGDFQADLRLTGGAKTTLGAVSVPGRLGPGTWDVTGAAGKITAGEIDSGFAVNFTGALAGLTVKGNTSGSLAAGSIGAVAISGNLAGGRILAGASLGSDAAVGGSGAAADSYGPGSIGTIKVAGTVTGSTILAGVHPFDGQFNDINDVAVGGRASSIKTISVTGSVDDTTRFDAGLLPARATLGGVKVATALDARFGQNRFALTDAGTTDADGRVTLNIAGQPQQFELLDEVTLRPLSGAGVAVAVDAQSRTFGVMTIVTPGRRVPVQMVVLEGTAAPAGARALMEAAPLSEPESDAATLLLSDVSTKATLDYGTDKLVAQTFYSVPEAQRDAINSKVGFMASAFTSLVSIGVHALDNVSHGAVSDFISELPGATNEMMTPAEAKSRIVQNRATDLTGTLLLAGMKGKLDPLAPYATAIDLGSDGVAWGVADMAEGLPGMGVRVTKILGMEVYSFAPIPPWQRAAQAGLVNVQIPTAADAENGFIELISKNNLGEAIVAPLDTAGNASIPVPLGSYFGVVHAAGFTPTEVPVTVTTTGTTTVHASLTAAPVPGFIVAPATTLQTSEGGTTATFTIALKTQPTANVTIGLISSDTSEGKLSRTSLVFTPANWATPQSVTVTGVNDSLKDGNQPYVIVTALAASADPAYDGLDPADVHAVNQDNEESGVPTVSLDELYIAERETQWVGDAVWGHWEDRYRIAGSATATGPVGTYLYTYRGAITGTFVMDAWTGLAGNHYRAAGDPVSTRFTFEIYTDWSGLNTERLPFTVRVEAVVWDTDPATRVTDSQTITLR